MLRRPDTARRAVDRPALALTDSGPYAEPDPDPLFDVAPFRVLTDRHAVVRQVGQPTVVLGSTQRAETVETERAAQLGVAVVRRRGGGGAVLLRPGDHLWIEAWIPRGDPLWDADVAAAAGWVGAWWSAALASRCAGACVVHEGRAEPGSHGALVCFSGKGPGEVFFHDRKVMGVSQWRGREGALFHTCAYTRWDPRPLVELLDPAGTSQEELVADLAGTAIGLDDLQSGEADLAVLGQELLSSFRDWGPGRSS